MIGFDNKVMAGAWLPGQSENILRVIAAVGFVAVFVGAVELGARRARWSGVAAAGVIARALLRAAQEPGGERLGVRIAQRGLRRHPMPASRGSRAQSAAG